MQNEKRELDIPVVKKCAETTTSPISGSLDAVETKKIHTIYRPTQAA
jgi:hypothetical protein